jgi:hypothetical protein
MRLRSTAGLIFSQRRHLGVVVRYRLIEEGHHRHDTHQHT